MKRLILLVLLFSVIVVKSQPHLSEKSIKEYKSQVEQMVGFLQSTLNFIGDPENSAHDKDIIFKESYTKIFRDANVQIEDDLDESRGVSINKDVQAYLKDIDFFFDKVNFTFDIQDITNHVNDKGDVFLKVAMVRTLTGRTITGDSICNSKNRFLEINLDIDNKELKIVSFYTTKPTAKDELYTWWNSMSKPWKDYFGKERFIYDSIELSQVSLILEDSYTRLSKKEFILQDSFMIVGNDTMSMDRIGELHGHRPDTVVFINDTISRFVNDTIKTDLTPIYEVLKQLTKITEVNVSDNKCITNLDPLSELSELSVLNCSGTNVSDITPIRNLNGIIELNISGTKITDISNLKYANVVQNFNADSTQIKDISIIGYYEDLINLSVSNTNVSDISSLSGCENLTTLNLSKTLVNEIASISNLSKLHDLDISNTYVGNLDSIKNLENLQFLNLENTPVTDLKEISNLKKLNEINLSNTEVTSLEPLNGLPQLSIIYCDNSLVTRTEADKYRAENPDKLVINETEALREWWNKLPTFWKPLLLQQTNIENINPTKEELHSIINVRSLKVSNVILDGAPISRLTNLEYLDLSGSKIDDLSPLSTLHNLKVLNINNTTISDITPLTNNNSLKELYIENTGIQSLKPLHGLDNLTKIYADGINLSTKEVYELNLMQRQVVVIYQTDKLRLWWGNLDDAWRDIFTSHTLCNTNPTAEQLHAMINLEEIVIEPTNEVSTLEPLSQLLFLRKLVVNNNQIKDLSPLSDKFFLETLSVGGNPVDNIIPLSDLLEIKELNIENTPVSDITPLEKLDKIKILNIGGTYVTNLKPLEGKTSLIDLSIVNTSIKNVEYVLTLTSLRYFKAYKTKIKKKNIDLLNEIRPDLNVTYY
mgnify:CR=1 FL=1